jgi:hypothetical protein
MKLFLGAALIVTATVISVGSALTPVSAVAASKVAENSQSPRATDFSARRHYRHYRHYGYSPRYYAQRRYYQPYYDSYGSSYGPGYYGGYPGYYGGYGYGRPGIGFSFRF